MWAIIGEHGFYTGTTLTRREMIKEHCTAYSHPLPSNQQIKRIW